MPVSRVRGLRLTTANLHRVGVDLEALVVPALELIGDKVRADMMLHVRKDTHKLEQNIVRSDVVMRRHSAFVKIGPNKKGWYARFLEFGTKLMGAFPFVRPARDRIRPEIKPRVRKTLAAGVKKP